MISLDLTIVCDEVITLEPTTNGQCAPVVKMILDDVRIEPLLEQLTKKLDIETILDCFSDDAIKGYLYEVDARADNKTSEQFPNV